MRATLATTFLSLFLLTAAGSLLTACNTTEGAGKDMSAAGKAIEHSADEHKSY